MSTAAEIVARYREIRDKRNELTRTYDKEYAKLSSDLDLIETAMLGFLNKNGMDSVATENGTFYKQEDILPTGADWDAFYRWVRENDAFDALERRIKKTFIKTYMDEHESGIPPGVSVLRKWEVRVRKS